MRVASEQLGRGKNAAELRLIIRALEVQLPETIRHNNNHYHYYRMKMRRFDSRRSRFSIKTVFQ